MYIPNLICDSYKKGVGGWCDIQFGLHKLSPPSTVMLVCYSTDVRMVDIITSVTSVPHAGLFDWPYTSDHRYGRRTSSAFRGVLPRQHTKCTKCNNRCLLQGF